MRIVAGEWRGRRIAAPPGRGTRPTTDRVREAWMSTIAPFLPGARVLDLFAGSGALGLEALSRGAEHATFVEDCPRALKVLRANVEVLGAGDRVTIVRSDAIRFLERVGQRGFDVAVADPPYGSGLAARLAERFRQRPFASVLSIEHARDEPLVGAEPELERRYGDTVVSYFEAPE